MFAGSVERKDVGQKNQLWEEDGGVLARAEVGDSGSVSMPDERVGMVSRVAEMERGMADGRDVLAVDGVSDLVGRNAGGESALDGRNNLFQVIEFAPNSSGGLVVEQNQRIRLVSNLNNQSLTEFENLWSGGNQLILDSATIEQLGGVCRKTKSVNAIVEGLLSPA
ncbi:hypothetical protein V6N13_065736 [Hibiscus sabdariffa]